MMIALAGSCIATLRSVAVRANVLLRVTGNNGVQSDCRLIILEYCLYPKYFITIDYYVLSAPYVLPELCTVKQYERYKKQIVQHGAPRCNS